MPSVVTSWSNPTPSSRNKLVVKTCATYGFDTNDTELAEVALEALDDTVNDLNACLFEFNKVIETGITMTANTNYVIPTSGSVGFYRDSLAYLVSTTGSQPQPPMNYCPWVQFERWFGDTTITGAPEEYSTFNFDSDNKVYLFPTPDTSTASNYTLTLEYYRRIPLVSSVGESSSIEVPREIENALVYGAQKRMAIHFLGASHGDVAALAGLEAQAMERLRRVDRAHPDEKKAWVLSDFAGRGRKRANTDFFIRY